MVIETANLVKEYNDRRVVNNVSIRVEQGSIVGLLGPNGAGKTTTFYMIVGIIKPDSGTVTLEAALCGLGCVIVYKTSPISAFIARRVINIPDIGLPNIVAARHILPELLQEDFTPEKTAAEALHLLEPERNAEMKQDLAYVKERLGAPGAVNRVAELILRVAKEKK